MQSSETLSSMGLERENLRENDEHSGHDEKYVNQVKSKEGVMNMQEMFNCEKCKMSAQSKKQLKKHMGEYHRVTEEDQGEDIEEEILFVLHKM